MLDDIAPETKLCLKILIANDHEMRIRVRELVQDD